MVDGRREDDRVRGAVFVVTGCASGIGRHLTSAIAARGGRVLATDLDADGVLDLFVGNDVSKFQDRYFKGDGAGGFTETARAL
ncbi:MAG TPA: hypothetical protein VGM56_29510, partial [Byssovorax sp.]